MITSEYYCAKMGSEHAACFLASYILGGASHVHTSSRPMTHGSPRGAARQRQRRVRRRWLIDSGRVGYHCDVRVGVRLSPTTSAGEVRRRRAASVNAPSQAQFQLRRLRVAERRGGGVGGRVLLG